MKDNSSDSFDSLFVKKKNNKKNNSFTIFVVIFAVIILSLVSIYGYLSIGVVRETMDLAKSKVQNAEAINSDQIDLLKEKAWLESRLKMADADSIGLAIDLKDQSIQLELKGVVVMKTRIRAYSTSGFFRKMDGNIYFSLFGTPLTIVSYNSSISKSPFKVKHAPKNEAEADSMSVVKKDTIKQDIYWNVQLDRDIELNIQGIDSISDAKTKYQLGKGFEFKRDLQNIGSALRKIVHFKKPDYTPEILICIPENDAKSILRALPRKAAMVTIRT